jgi:hypothetical protein
MILHRKLRFKQLLEIVQMKSAGSKPAHKPAFSPLQEKRATSKS